MGVATPPLGWWVATDGSGQTIQRNGDSVAIAGWGAVIWRWPLEGDAPDFVLHAPVVVEEWDPLWLGARVCTNNTAELSAVGEVMIWLLNDAPDDGHQPVKIRYDSYYAADVAQGVGHRSQMKN